MVKTLKPIGISNDFLNKTAIAQQIRTRTDKWDFIKLEGFCTAKEVVTRLKRQSKEWKKNLS
jgi:hypothetical protein